MGRPAAFAASLTLLASLPGTAAGGQSAYRQVLSAYEQQGAIAPCRFSAGALAAALKGTDVYGQQYFADFTAAVQAALSQRAAGACSPSRGTAFFRLRPAAQPSSSAGARPPGTGAGGTGNAPVPAAILAMGVGMALLALMAAASMVARFRGTDLAVTTPWRHLWQEAGWRASGVWEEFRDWLRPN